MRTILRTKIVLASFISGAMFYGMRATLKTRVVVLCSIV